jgi:hypothetical protein
MYAGMEYPWMLDSRVEYDHRGRLLKYYGFQDNTHRIEPLQCRTPNEYWMIHPSWIERYKLFVLILLIILAC